MTERPVTPVTYLGEMVAMSWTHGRELTAAVTCAIALPAALLFALSPRPAHALFLLASAIAALLLFEAATAAWRLHRRQRIALATTRSLLDLNATGRAEAERHLHSRYRRREARIHERNAARVERLSGEIDALQTEILGRSHRRVSM
jgi:hypothetical protein